MARFKRTKTSQTNSSQIQSHHLSMLKGMMPYEQADVKVDRSVATEIKLYFLQRCCLKRNLHKYEQTTKIEQIYCGTFDRSFAPVTREPEFESTSSTFSTTQGVIYSPR